MPVRITPQRPAPWTPGQSLLTAIETFRQAVRISMDNGTLSAEEVAALARAMRPMPPAERDAAVNLFRDAVDTRIRTGERLDVGEAALSALKPLVGEEVVALLSARQSERVAPSAILGTPAAGGVADSALLKNGYVDHNDGTPFGSWVGIDGTHGTASPQDERKDHRTGLQVGDTVVRIPRRVDPQSQGPALIQAELDRLQAVGLKAPYAALLEADDGTVEPNRFYELIAQAMPADVLKTIEVAVAETKTLHRLGLNPPPPADERYWRQSVIQCSLHSVDLELRLKLLGYPKSVGGKHDLVEFAPLKDLRFQMETKAYPEWFGAVVDKLEAVGQVMIEVKNRGGDDAAILTELTNRFPEHDVQHWMTNFLSIDLTHPKGEQIKVNISALGPFGGPMVLWGDSREDANALMDPHRLSDHHNGNAHQAVDKVERAANFNVHHMPREHGGIRHLPVGEWKNHEKTIQSDHAISGSGILKAISRDDAVLAELCEKAGLNIPWQKLRKPEGVQHFELQRAYETVQAQNFAGDKVLERQTPLLELALRKSGVPAWTKDGATTIRAALKALPMDAAAALPVLSSLVDQLAAMQTHAAGTKNPADDRVLRHLGECLGASIARLSVRDEPSIVQVGALLTRMDVLLEHEKPSYHPLEEMVRAVTTLAQLPDAIAKCKAQDDATMSSIYETWNQLYQGGFAFPRLPGGGLTAANNV